MAHVWRRCAAQISALALATAAHAGATLQFVTEPFPPFNFEENGQVAGPMVDVLQLVCKSAQIRCTTHIMPWRRALAMAEAGQVDGIFSLLHGPEKAQNFILSDPVIRTAYSFFAPKGSGWNYATPRSLEGMTIGVYGPSSTSITLNDLAAGVSNTKIAIEVSNFDALKTLSLGGYGPQGVIFINRDVGLSMTKSMNLPDIRPAGDARQIAYCFGLSKKSPRTEKIAAFNRALRQRMATGEVALILARYGMKSPPPAR